LAKYGLGFILGDFFTTASGHTDQKERMSLGGRLLLRIARFILVHDTITGENVPKEHEMYPMVITHPIGP
jgi:hypothetical protein